MILNYGFKEYNAKHNTGTHNFSFDKTKNSPDGEADKDQMFL